MDINSSCLIRAFIFVLNLIYNFQDRRSEKYVNVITKNITVRKFVQSLNEIFFWKTRKFYSLLLGFILLRTSL